jgi:hypothetical protein
MDRIGEPFRSAERIRDALRNDRILVIGRIADKGPAVAKSLAEKVRQIAGASDPRSVIATRRVDLSRPHRTSNVPGRPPLQHFDPGARSPAAPRER